MAALFQAHPELAIFVAIVLGFLVGRVHVRGVGLGTVVGTLLAGLAIGILSKPAVPDLLKWAFFDLLLFAIGYATGPQFFAGLKKEAIPQIYIAFIVSVTGLAAALGVAWAFSFDAGIAAGVTSGSLTQSAALGTALVTIADLPIAADLKQTLSAHVPIADAVTYVTGDVGVIVFLLAAAPMLLRANLREEAVKLEDAMSGNAPNAALRSAVQRFGFRVSCRPAGLRGRWTTTFAPTPSSRAATSSRSARGSRHSSRHKRVGDDPAGDRDRARRRRAYRGVDGQHRARRARRGIRRSRSRPRRPALPCRGRAARGRGAARPRHGVLLHGRDLQLGYDPLHFGIILVIAVGIGLFSRPFGVGMYATCTIIAKTRLQDVARPYFRYVLVLLAALVLLVAWPAITLWLPRRYGLA